MQLTRHTDYAFRVLIYLSSLREGQLATVQEIAERYDVSRNHMMKIVQKLAAAGLIQATRGQGGGLRLGQSSESINLRSVVELMEATLAPVNCDAPACLIQKSCNLRSILFEAQKQFLEYVGRYTLADLVGTRIPLAKRLDQERHGRPEQV